MIDNASDVSDQTAGLPCCLTDKWSTAEADGMKQVLIRAQRTSRVAIRTPCGFYPRRGSRQTPCLCRTNNHISISTEHITGALQIDSNRNKMSTVHSVAKAGFGSGTNDLYDRYVCSLDLRSTTNVNLPTQSSSFLSFRVTAIATRHASR